MFKLSAFRVLILSGASALLLSTSACTWLEDWPPRQTGQVFTPQTETVSPEPTVVQTAQGTWLQQPARQQPVAVKSQEQKLKELENAAKERDAALARLADLERQMAEVNQNMQAIVPAMSQIAKTQTQIQNEMRLKEQMEVQAAAQQAQENHQMAMQELQQTMKQHSTMQNKAPVVMNHNNEDVIMGDSNDMMKPVSNQAMPKGLHVKDFRVGDGPDRTRLVFETNGDLKFDYDLDNNEKLMVLTLSKTHWAALPEKVMGPQALLSSYKAVENPDGSTSIVMQLNQPIKVEWARMFTPSAGAPYRLIMDLAAM